MNFQVRKTGTADWGPPSPRSVLELANENSSSQTAPSWCKVVHSLKREILLCAKPKANLRLEPL
jgi:hypothetical protein